MSKLTETDSVKIVSLYSVDEVPIPQLAKRFAVSNQAIRDVLRKHKVLLGPTGRDSINLRDASLRRQIRRRERKAISVGKAATAN
jgi:predicted DNA-binding protein YlxM (UPF0122 family)